MNLAKLFLDVVLDVPHHYARIFSRRHQFRAGRVVLCKRQRYHTTAVSESIVHALLLGDAPQIDGIVLSPGSDHLVVQRPGQGRNLLQVEAEPAGSNERRVVLCLVDANIAGVPGGEQGTIVGQCERVHRLEVHALDDVLLLEFRGIDIDFAIVATDVDGAVVFGYLDAVCRVAEGKNARRGLLSVPEEDDATDGEHGGEDGSGRNGHGLRVQFQLVRIQLSVLRVVPRVVPAHGQQSRILQYRRGGDRTLVDLVRQIFVVGRDDPLEGLEIVQVPLADDAIGIPGVKQPVGVVERHRTNGSVVAGKDLDGFALARHGQDGNLVVGGYRHGNGATGKRASQLHATAGSLFAGFSQHVLRHFPDVLFLDGGPVRTHLEELAGPVRGRSDQALVVRSPRAGVNGSGVDALELRLEAELLAVVDAQCLVASHGGHERAIRCVPDAIDALRMRRFARFFVLDADFLKGGSLVEVDLPVILSTGCKTKGPIGFEGNGSRFALDVLSEATLGVSCVPYNDSRADGLRSA
mmetsp:Transcript_25114/g.69270  ORF Transcript_25114/g.69270 Transcript_25114/m.69270 type:complete len:523 (+) Transcript_25114:1434-3002(+)